MNESDDRWAQCDSCEFHYVKEFELYEKDGKLYCMDCLYNGIHK